MRQSWLLATCLASVTLQGCYVYGPVANRTPPIGQTVVLSITDQGRVELGDRMGPGVSRIEARVTELNDNQLAMNVYGVTYVSGESSRWSGETMRLDRRVVDQVGTRRLSKTRTWLAVGVGTVAVSAFIATHGLSSIFSGDREDPPQPPPSSLRFKLNFPF
jgi:hypothetical protein